MRKWMRERGKRGKSSENPAESTGKIGQQIDPSKPAPLVPSYDSDAAPSHETQPPARHEERPARHESSKRHTKPAAEPVADYEEETDTSDRRVEVETQPDSPSTPSDSGDVMRKQPHGKREPRGVVVLTIG